MLIISEKIEDFIARAMENWRVELVAGCQTRAKVKIKKRCIPMRLIIASTIC